MLVVGLTQSRACYYRTMMQHYKSEHIEPPVKTRHHRNITEELTKAINCHVMDVSFFFFKQFYISHFNCTIIWNWCSTSTRSVRVAERLALPTSGHGVAGSNPAGGEILPEPKRRFIAQSFSCSSFHRLEVTEILLKGRKTLTHHHLLVLFFLKCCLISCN